MPTYTVTSTNLTLTTDQEADIAAAITRSHHENTGAPAYFAQVIFERIEAERTREPPRLTINQSVLE